MRGLRAQVRVSALSGVLVTRQSDHLVGALNKYTYSPPTHPAIVLKVEDKVKVSGKN